MRREDDYTKYECVAVSSRIRLARNFVDYPFPSRLLQDPHAVEQANELIAVVKAELIALEAFQFYSIRNLDPVISAYLMERNRISRDLIANAAISAVLITKDEDISVMINEEDHIRAQYFTRGYDLKRAYERIAGIEEVISENVPFAYDRELGYLTACPTNLGTGMRASVMLFLPALSRRGLMTEVKRSLDELGMTLRGASGEGSRAEGELFQLSNRTTLGYSENDILDRVEEAVRNIVEFELSVRFRMKVEERIALRDRAGRAYGIAAYCSKLGLKEWTELAADIKLGIALGFLGADSGDTPEGLMERVDDLIVSMRPANINRTMRTSLSEEERDIYRAEVVSDALRKMNLD